MQALQAGEVDLVPSVSPEQLGELDYYVPTDAPAWTAFVKLNAHDSLLSDQKVREALNYAVDKESIVDGLFAGYATPLACQFQGSQPFANKELEPWPYDPEKAKELIEEAGATGKKLTIDWSTGLWTLDRQVGQLVQQELSETGLDVTIRFNPPESQLEKVYEAGASAGQGQFTGTSDALGDASRSIGLFLPSEGLISIYTNKALDAKIAAAEINSDADARAAAYREIMADSCEQAAVLYLYEWDEIFGLSNRLTWNPGANSTGGRWYYEEMTVVEPCS
jgi:peptide/nickel transport system substrate-binding protein